MRASYAFSLFKKLAKRLRKITRKKIFFIFKVYVLPNDLQHPYNMSKFNEAVKIAISPGFGIMNGGVRSNHFFQKKNHKPLSLLYLHACIVSLNVRWNIEKGRFEVFDPSDEDELIEESWRSALYEAFDGYKPKSNKRLTYFKSIEFCKRNEPEIKRLLMYAFKSPLIDLADTNWDEVSDDEARLFRFIIENRFNRISWYGFLADNMKSYYLSKLNIECILFREFLELRNRCPICKSPLEPLPKELIEKLGLNNIGPPERYGYATLVFAIRQDRLYEALANAIMQSYHISDKAMLDNMIELYKPYLSLNYPEFLASILANGSSKSG